MYKINFWNQFYLYRKKILIFLILIFTGTYTYAQKNHLHLTNVDKKKIHFGFQIGAFRSYLNIKNSDASLGLSDPSKKIEIKTGATPGFQLGFLINLSLADELWDLRFSPSVAFYERSLEISVPSTVGGAVINTVHKLETSVLEIPILLQYKSIRRGNFRMYFLGGITPGIEVGGKNKGRANDPNVMALNTFNLEVTYGVGLDKYLEFVKFSPELRFSHSFNNLLKSNGSEPDQFIDKITTNKVSLIINFEG